MTERDVQEASPLFRVFTCGPFRVERLDGRAYQPVRVSEWGGSQDPRRLLKKLACSPGRRARRGEILEALWPDIDPKEAGGYLNDAAYKLRAVLQPSKEQRKQTLLLTAEDASSFGLPGQKVLWIDADSALTLLEQAEDAERTGAEIWAGLGLLYLLDQSGTRGLQSRPVGRWTRAHEFAADLLGTAPGGSPSFAGDAAADYPERRDSMLASSSGSRDLRVS